MKKKILSILVCLSLTVAGFGVSVVPAAAEDTPDYTILDLTDKTVNGNGQFDSIKTKTNMMADGTLYVKHDISLDQNYIDAKRTALEAKVEAGEIVKENFPKREDYGSDGAYLEDVSAYNDAFYANIGDEILPKLELSIAYDRRVYCLYDLDLNVTIRDKDTNDTICTCTASEDANGNTVLDIRFSKIVYNRTNTDVTLRVDFICKTLLSAGEILAPEWDSYKNIITGQPAVVDEGYVAIDPAYTLKVTAPASATATYINYRVDASVDDGILNGKTVILKIPEGLTVAAVSLDGTTLGEEDYGIAGGNFRYTFPVLNEDSSNLSKKAILTVRMNINEAKRRQMVQDQTHSAAFEVVGYLKNLTKNERITDLSTASSTMTLPFFTFDAKSLSLDSVFAFNFKGYLLTVPADDAYMEFNVSGIRTVKVPFREATVDALGRYVFTCYLDVLEVDEKVIATFHNGSDSVRRPESISITDYLDDVREHHTYNTTVVDLATLELVDSVSNYAHWAQAALDESHDDYTVGENGKYHATEARSDVALMTNGEVSGFNVSRMIKTGYTAVAKTSRSLVLDDEISIVLYLKLSDTVADDYVPAVVVRDKNGALYDFTSTRQADGRWKIVIPDIAANELADTFFVDIDNGGITFTNLSALSYASSVFGNAQSSDNYKYAVSALYRYYTATVAYVRAISD